MRVFVDMDSVVADFDHAIQTLMPYSQQDWRHVHSNYIKRAFESITDTDFFEHIPVFAGTNTLLKSIQNIAGGYTILSKPLIGDWENSKKHKIKWCEKNLTVEPDDLIFVDDKSQYASGNVLIDDQELIILDWEKSGGYGIHFDAAKNKLSDVLIPLQTLYRRF